MADFNINRIRFTWKSDWVTGFAYTKDDIVRYGGKSYVCLVGHVASPDFNTDLDFIDVSTNPDTPKPYWVLWFDGYEWHGAWTPNTFYNLGDYVQYGSIIYICNDSHTSAIDYATGLEVDQGKWTRYAVTDDWKTDWTVNTRYKLNDVVRYGGTLYRCNYGHTSALTPTLGLEADLGHWDPLTYGNDWKTDWLVNTRYKVGDVVRYGGIIYKCTLGHTSAATITIGIDPDLSSWTIVHNGIDYKAAWTQPTRYKLNDIVKYGPDLYICTTAHTSGTVFSTANFTIWIPGLEFVNGWNVAVSYAKGDVITYGGYEYTSNITNNVGNVPSTDTVSWTLLVKNYNVRNEWDVAANYRVGDLVRRNGYLYVAIADSLGVETTVNTVWELVVPGMRWTNGWSGGATATIVSGSGTGTLATLVFSNRIGAPFVIGSQIVVTGVAVNGYNTILATVVRCTATSVTYANTTTTSFTGGSGVLSITGKTYTLGDVVTYYASSYMCTLKHTAIPAVTPLLDTTTIVTPITGAVASGSVITLTFVAQAVQPYQPGQTITVANVSPSGYNGTYIVTSASATTVAYASTFSTPYSSGGTITNNSTYWTLYVKGDQFETLQYQGDIQTYNATQWSPVTLGQEGDLLKVNASLLPVPAWNQFGPVGGVYYVANTGTDAEGFGATLNTPFKTIRYACSKVTGPATIFVKTGYYSETLPITVPAGVALVGDELRGTTVQPANTISTTGLATIAVSNLITVTSTVGLTDNMPLRFTNASVSSLCTGTYFEGGNGIIIISTAGMVAGMPIVFSGAAFGNIVPGTTYYIVNVVNSNTITMSATLNGPVFVIKTDSGSLTVTAGNFGGLTSDTLYFVKAGSITPTQFQVTTVVGGSVTALQSAGGALTSSTTYSGITGTSAIPAGIYQGVIPFGGTSYPGLSSISSGAGTGATFSITKTGTSTSYNGSISISIISPGIGYQIGDTVTILGTQFGTGLGWTSLSPDNNLTFTIGGVITTNAVSITAGDTLQNMFYVRNGSGIRNMTLRGLSSTLGPANSYGTRRPLAGAYVSLDPGAGPTDSNAWITSKSPYVQNVTTFGTGCVGCKIDGSLHNGGNRSIVANDFTQILSDGIGIWCTNAGSLTELVSVFTYYGHIGYLAENGGKIRATNGNTSYGLYGAVAEGFDLTESALTGAVNNRNQQAQIALAFAGEATNKIVKLEFSNAGSNYTTGSIGFTGSGTGAICVVDEFRDNGVFEARITGADYVAGGSGYITASNQAQAGDMMTVTIASNDLGTFAMYSGMRLLITSGTGVGQYGYIQNYDVVSKIINVAKESFSVLTATATTSTNNLITVADTSTLYVGMPIAFTPNTQIVTVSKTTNKTATMGSSTIDASGVLTVGTLSGTITTGMLLSGGTIGAGVYITSQLTFSPTPSATTTLASGGVPPNATLVVTSAVGIVVGQLVTGTGVPANTTVLTVNLTTITLSNNFAIQGIGTYNFYSASTGSTWQTNTTTPQTSTVITGVENTVTVSSTTGMWVTKPIVFSGSTIFGGLLGNTTYYILAIIGNKLVVSTTLGYPVVTLLNASGTMTGTASGTLGGVSSTTIYYVIAANFSGTQFAISTTLNGPAFTLTTLPAGQMTISAIGWDNIIQGLPSVALLDSTSVYSIEPRVTFSSPPYLAQSATSIANGTWVASAFGAGQFIAIASNGATSASTDAVTWQTKGSLPPPASAWTDVAYGNGRWVAVGSGTGSGSAYTTDGLTWSSGSTTLGTGSWSIAFGGTAGFIAVCSNATTSAISSDGNTWTVTASALPSAATWASVAYGSIGIYVAIASGGTSAASSPDGIVWTARTLPGTSANWTSVAWGNGRFVAIASGGASTAYSFDGINWILSSLPTATTWTNIGYGQGLFFAVASGTASAATSPDGLTWTARLLTAATTWSSVTFGNPTAGPVWSVLSSSSTTNNVNAGARAIGRASVASSRISLIKIWEPGSSYAAATVTVTDPNATTPVGLQARVGLGALGQPTFVNRGSGYRSSTTVATVSGNGYADIYQNSKLLSVSGLLTLPTPGAALTFAGNTAIYRIVLITDLSGGKALFQVSPALTNTNAPEHSTAISIRQKYSQCRITGHDFLLIGTGNATTTNFPNVDVTTATSYRQMNENGGGRVFQTSTDQDGNFMVGNLFGVQQASGIVTISADQFSLSGLDKLQIGGFQIGSNSVQISQFSTDSYFTANSDSVVPTQRAIKTYLARNIAGGGSNAQTGQIVAGTVGVGGPNKIFSSTQTQIVVTNTVNINGGKSGMNGTMLAAALFSGGFGSGPQD